MYFTHHSFFIPNSIYIKQFKHLSKMKNKMIIAFLFIAMFIGKTKAQIPIYKQPYKPLKEFKGDITKYFLYNVIDMKDELIGKKVSTILDILEPDVITYLPFFQGSYYTTGLNLFYNNIDTTIIKDKKQKELELHFSFYK